MRAGIAVVLSVLVAANAFAAAKFDGPGSSLTCAPHICPVTLLFAPAISLRTMSPIRSRTVNPLSALARMANSPATNVADTALAPTFADILKADRLVCGKSTVNCDMKFFT